MKKREYGSGGITPPRDSNGVVESYQAQIRIRTADGRSRLKTIGSTKTRREAQNMLRQAQIDLAAGQLSASPRRSLAQYLDSWLERKGREKERAVARGREDEALRYSTLRSYRRNCALIEAAIGPIQLDELRRPHVKQLHEVLAESGLGAQSVKQAHAVLHTALQEAVEERIAPSEPRGRQAGAADRAETK